VRDKHPNKAPHQGPRERYWGGLDWEKLRADYRAKRRAEGATEEEIAAETIDGKEIVMAKDVPKKPVKVEEPRTMGPPKGSPRVGGRQKDAQLALRIVMLHDEGHVVPDIATMCEVSSHTVRAYLRDAGIEPRKGKGNNKNGHNQYN
jgi:hypothetical protein